MARIDTLTNFLTDVANAIRSKTGDSSTIACEDFDTEIENIPTGGGSNLQTKSVTITENGTTNVIPDTGYDGMSSVSITTNVPTGGTTSRPKKDVNFYDYDGTIVNSYTKSEFLSLSSLPNNPTHDGLIAEGWNWRLVDAKSYVTTYGKLNIGQMYIPTNGLTTVDVDIPYDNFTCYFGGLSVQQNTASGYVEIDWGDGSPTVRPAIYTNRTTLIFVSHTYTSKGSYTIKYKCNDILKSSSGIIGNSTVSSTRLIGYNSSSSSAASSEAFLAKFVKSVCVGDGLMGIGSYGFRNLRTISKITMPHDITTISEQSFYNCQSLPSITLPSDIVIIGTRAFYNCTALRTISMSNKIRTINTYAFSNCTALTEIELPDSVDIIPTYCFANCSSLYRVTMPKSVTTISSNAFQSCNVAIFDFSHHESIPTLAANALGSMLDNSKIIVPDNLYENWIVAENWSSYSSRIVKVSDL